MSLYDPKLFPVCSFCRQPGGAVYTGRSSPRHFGTCELLGCGPSERSEENWELFFGMLKHAHADGRLFVIDPPDADHPHADMPRRIARIIDVPLLSHLEVRP